MILPWALIDHRVVFTLRSLKVVLEQFQCFGRVTQILSICFHCFRHGADFGYIRFILRVSPCAPEVG